MNKRRLGKSAAKNIHKFSSNKNNQLIPVESTLEYDACFHFEYSPQVSKYESQPLGFFWIDGDKERKYTPDFYVEFHDNVHIYFEVKPQRKTESVAFMHEFALKQKAAVEQNKRLELITDKQIRTQPLLENLKIIHRYSGFAMENVERERIVSCIAQHEWLSIDNIAANLNLHIQFAISNVFKLIGKGILQTDLGQSFEHPTHVKVQLRETHCE